MILLLDLNELEVYYSMTTQQLSHLGKLNTSESLSSFCLKKLLMVWFHIDVLGKRFLFQEC